MSLAADLVGFNILGIVLDQNIRIGAGIVPVAAFEIGQRPRGGRRGRHCQTPVRVRSAPGGPTPGDRDKSCRCRPVSGSESRIASVAVV